MNNVLGVLSILEIVVFFALLHYGSVTHKQWPNWLAMVVAAIVLVHLGFEQVNKHKKTN
ncbi:MAG: hypothetical protein ACRYFU_04355 [Janthinobacterium lividum]